jgi:hypothetical protein
MHVLSAGSRARIGLGPYAIEVETVPAGPRRARWLPSPGSLAHNALSAAVPLGVLALVGVWAGKLATGAELDGETYRERVLLLTELDALVADNDESSAPRADDEESSTPRRSDDEPGRARPLVAPRTVGSQTRVRDNADAAVGLARWDALGRPEAVGRPRREADPYRTREAVLSEARAFGAAGLVDRGAFASARAPGPGWGAAANDGGYGWGELGPLWEGETADAGWGVGGIVASLESDDHGEGIAIGDIGSLGLGRCGGCGDTGRLGSHAMRTMTLWECGETDSKLPNGPRSGSGCVFSTYGRLPPEAIRRVVQDNHGRFRGCYERGIERNPALHGRVETQFVIGRDGAVTFAVDAGSDLPDRAVVRCVVEVFRDLSFPAPAGGTVGVVYPLTFSPE